MKINSPACILILLFHVSMSPMPYPSPTNSCYKTKPTNNFSYEEVHSEPTFKNLKMLGAVGDCGIESPSHSTILYGGILRSMRFKNITEMVEDKYDLPRNLLLAMIIQETHGADLLPNCLDDGGIGLCHMQGSTAYEFGLKTYKNFNKLRSTTHGRELRKLIQTHKYDRKKLIVHDDRFHPIYNIDAAGRMLHCYMHKPRIKGLTKVQMAIRYYAGKYNYRKYWRNVSYYQDKLNDPEVLAEVERRFNSLNKSLLINGRKGDYKGYIAAHQQQNYNYGLASYK
ncbi:MAG: hypothetical protein AAF694_09385 [Bacteroidota bacterium]